MVTTKVDIIQMIQQQMGRIDIQISTKTHITIEIIIIIIAITVETIIIIEIIQALTVIKQITTINPTKTECKINNNQTNNLIPLSNHIIQTQDNDNRLIK